MRKEHSEDYIEGSQDERTYILYMLRKIRGAVRLENTTKANSALMKGSLNVVDRIERILQLRDLDMKQRSRF